MVQTNSTDNYATARFIVSATAGYGNYTSITSALAAASSGDTVFILPGTYTEDLTLVTGVDIVAYEADAFTPNVTIVGKLSASGAEIVSMSGLNFETNSDYFLSVTGSGGCNINFINCYFDCVDHTGISFASTSATATLNITSCQGDIGTTGISFFTSSSAGSINISSSRITNSGSSSTTSTVSDGAFYANGCNFFIPFASSSTGIIGANWTSFSGSAVNTTPLDASGATTHNLYWCFFDGGTASAITIGAGATVVLTYAGINSSNVNTLNGSGTIYYSDLSFYTGSTYLINVSTTSQLVNGLPFAVGNGGTGATTLTGVLTGNGSSAITANAVTQHGVLLGGASNAVSSLAVADTGTILSGVTGSDPLFTATPSVTSITTTSITFGAGTALSSYVESTWTPVLSFGGGTTGITYSQQSGYYTRIGNAVFFTCEITLTSKGSDVGNASIAGLPLASGTANDNVSIAYFSNVTLDANYTNCFVQLPASSSTLNVFQIGSAQAAIRIDDTNIANNSVISFNGFYIINS